MELPEPKKLFIGGKLVGHNIDSRRYHSQLDGVARGDPQFVLSRSELMLFASNPARWMAGYAPKDTDATEWGSLMDCLVTDPGRFEERFALQPATQEATKTMGCVKDGEARIGDMVPWSPQSSFAKTWKREAEASGKQIVTPADHTESQEALKKLNQDGPIKALLDCSKFQVMCVSEYFDRTTEVTVPVKCLIDIVPALETEFQNDLADFKTCRNGEPSKWQTVVEDRHYDVQAIMSLDIYNAATKECRTGFRHVLQESEYPFAIGRRYLESATLAIGWMKMVAALELYAKCLKSGQWPGWDDTAWGEFRNYNGWTGISPKEWTLRRYLGDARAI